MNGKLKSELSFRAVTALFSACLLVLTLLCSVRLAAAEDQADRLEKQIRTLQTENEILRVEAENNLSLEAIEQYATDKLGMQRCSPGQITLIEISE